MAIEVRMKREQVIFLTGVSLLFGAVEAGAQEATQQLPTTVVEQPVGPLYRNQANVEQSKMMHDRELEQAARDARIEKELKAAMAAQGMSARPPVIRTAEEFLAANKPPTPPPSDTPRPEPRRGGDYVPPFEIPDDPTARSNSRVSAESGPSAEEAMIESTGGIEMPEKKEGFFSRLFGGKKSESSPESAPPAMPSEYPTVAQDDTLPPEPAPEMEQNNSFEIPDAPGINDAPVAPPEPPSQPVAASGGSIFKGKKPAAASGTKLTVVSDVNATVAGVLVKLFEGDEVEMLGQTGALAQIRLKDQRVGTVPASALR
ncbi:MAG: hypothetical protein P1U86_16080 [Verrucomicrobiales bacterium]|nr:hypothetical protein [Verrucomicrobiales bacterium]